LHMAASLRKGSPWSLSGHSCRPSAACLDFGAISARANWTAWNSLSPCRTVCVRRRSGQHETRRPGPDRASVRRYRCASLRVSIAICNPCPARQARWRSTLQSSRIISQVEEADAELVLLLANGKSGQRLSTRKAVILCIRRPGQVRRDKRPAPCIGDPQFCR